MQDICAKTGKKDVFFCKDSLKICITALITLRFVISEAGFCVENGVWFCMLDFFVTLDFVVKMEVGGFRAALILG